MGAEMTRDEYIRTIETLRSRPDQWQPDPISEEDAAKKQAERIDAEFWCESCDEAVDPDTKYECQCGNEFGLEDVGSHQCPECGRFAAKAGENYCPECLEEVVTGEEAFAAKETK